MSPKKFTRRQVLATTSAGALATMVWPITSCGSGSSVKDKLAIKGGDPIRKTPWMEWPVWDQEAEKGITDMLRTGRWWLGSGEHVAEFEKLYAEKTGR